MMILSRKSWKKDHKKVNLLHTNSIKERLHLVRITGIQMETVFRWILLKIFQTEIRMDLVWEAILPMVLTWWMNQIVGQINKLTITQVKAIENNKAKSIILTVKNCIKHLMKSFKDPKKFRISKKMKMEKLNKRGC